MGAEKRKPFGKLSVTIVNARELKNKDLLSKSDPYCKLQLGKKREKTTTKDGELNPDWEETFEFDVHEGEECVALSLWDKNSFEKDEFMGYTFISFNDCYKDTETEKVVSLMGATKGKITVKITPQFDTAATRFAKLEHEVNRMSEENNRFSANNDRLEGEIDRLGGEINKMTEENEKFAENNKKLEANVNRLEGEVDKMCEENNKFAENNEKLEKEVGKLTEENTKFAENNKKLEENVDRLSRELNKMSEENNKFAENNKKLEAEVGKMTQENERFAKNNEKQEIENKKFTASNEQLKKQIGILERQLDKMTEENNKFSKNNEDLKAQVDKLGGEVEKMSELNNELEATKDALNANVVELQGQISKIGEENTKFEENNKQLEAQIEEMKEEINKFSVENDKFKQNNNKLGNEVRKMEKENNKLEKNNQKLGGEIRRLQGEVEKMTKENNKFAQNNEKLEQQVLDELAKEGLKLEQHYTQPECSTTRASLLTSRYVVRTGLQADVILNGGGMALPQNETIWPQFMKQLGYENYLVGKWHQGFNSWRETPVYRGFDYFYGYYGGQIHYFGHYHTKFGGHDLRRDYRDKYGTFHQDILKKEQGVYLTKLLTDDAIRILKEHDRRNPMFMYFSLPNVHSPNQSPTGYVKKYCPDNTEDYDRKQLSGNLGGLEEAVKNFTSALKSSDLWDDTLLVFMSDNGGAPTGLTSYAGHSNYPLRSGKTTQFEGALRVPAFVTGPLVKHLAGQESHGLFHVSDWMPTIASYVTSRTGKQVKLQNEIDGVDNSQMIFRNRASNRNDILFQLHRDKQVYRLGDYKIIMGNAGEYDGWNVHEGREKIQIKYDEPTTNMGKIKCALGLCGLMGDYIYDEEGNKLRLYNLRTDPSETYNVAHKYPDIVDKMKSRLKELRAIVRPAQDNRQSPAAHQKKSGGIWRPWRHDVDETTVAYNILSKTEL